MCPANPAEIYTHQNAKYCGSLTVDEPEEDIREIYDARSTDLWLPNIGSFARSSELQASQAHTLSMTAFSVPGVVAVQWCTHAPRMARQLRFMPRLSDNRLDGMTSQFCNGHCNKELLWPAGRSVLVVHFDHITSIFCTCMSQRKHTHLKWLKCPLKRFIACSPLALSFSFSFFLPGGRPERPGRPACPWCPGCLG